MPNRVLREGLIYSDAVNGVSEAAEVLYVRLLLTADDFGLIETSPGYVKAKCLPARGWSTEKVVGALAELVEAKLIRPYEAKEKGYAAIEKWAQRRFARFPKYPEPPWGFSHVQREYTDARLRGREEAAKAKAEGKTPRQEGRKREERPAFVVPEWVPEGPWKAWLEVRPKVKAPNTPRALELAVAQLAKLRDEGHDPVVVLNEATVRGWRGLFAPGGNGTLAVSRGTHGGRSIGEANRAAVDEAVRRYEEEQAHATR